MNIDAMQVAMFFTAVLAVSPIGALMAASLAGEYVHVAVMLYWIGGFATVSNTIAVFGL
jgi:hypothetical protein